MLEITVPAQEVWDGEKEEWYFSIVDVVAVLTEQKTTRGASTYWSVLKPVTMPQSIKSATVTP